MERIVDDHSIKQHLVLNRRTTPDVQLPSLVSRKNHTGLNLKYLSKVGLTAYRGHLLHFLWSKLGNRCSDLG